MQVFLATDDPAVRGELQVCAYARVHMGKSAGCVYLCACERDCSDVSARAAAYLGLCPSAAQCLSVRLCLLIEACAPVGPKP